MPAVSHATAPIANVLGMYFCGHEAFRERHQAVFGTVFKGTTLTPCIATLRFVRPDVAMADLIPDLHRGGLEGGPVRQLILIGLGILTITLL